MYRSLRIGLLSSAVFAVALAPRAAAEVKPLTQKQFDQLHQVIKPQPGEDKWKDIPWMANLWEARKRAAAEGKPILLWEMDGHPLGCV